MSLRVNQCEHLNSYYKPAREPCAPSSPSLSSCFVWFSPAGFLCVFSDQCLRNALTRQTSSQFFPSVFPDSCCLMFLLSVLTVSWGRSCSWQCLCCVFFAEPCLQKPVFIQELLGLWYWHFFLSKLFNTDRNDNFPAVSTDAFASSAAVSHGFGHILTSDVLYLHVNCFLTSCPQGPGAHRGASAGGPRADVCRLPGVRVLHVSGGAAAKQVYRDSERHGVEVQHRDPGQTHPLPGESWSSSCSAWIGMNDSLHRSTVFSLDPENIVCQITPHWPHSNTVIICNISLFNKLEG